MEQYRIIKALSGFYYVQTEDGVVECRARGRFRRQDQSPLVGDFVRITRQGAGKGVLEELLPRKNAFIRPAVALLAGIPSIIYGFFGMIIIRPFIAQLTGGLGFGALTAWFVLAIMIVPTITTLTIDALNSIPMGIREASYAMGATKWQTIYKVVLPAAKLGIVDAIVLGMGRAIGETMAVLMVVGNAPVIPDSIASPISTLTSQIALDMSYSSGLHRSALFGMGVVLFIISATLVGIVRLISKKKRG